MTQRLILACGRFASDMYLGGCNAGMLARTGVRRVRHWPDFGPVDDPARSMQPRFPSRPTAPTLGRPGVAAGTQRHRTAHAKLAKLRRVTGTGPTRRPAVRVVDADLSQES